jgi:hypothetical protein
MRLNSMLLYFLGFLSLLPIAVEAHDLPYTAINTELRAQGSRITLHTLLKQDVSSFYYLGNSDDTAKLRFYEQYFSKNFVISQNTELCSFELSSLLIKDGQTLSDGQFSCPNEVRNIKELAIRNSLFAEEFVSFDHFVTVNIANEEWDLVFNKTADEYPAEVDAKAGFSALRFLRLGLEHIFTGYDHILFILSLVLLVSSFRRIFALVTSFTLAHSITLFLAGLNIIRLSPAIVEPVIAASIAYVAWRNIERLKNGMIERLNTEKSRQKLGERWFASFGFGLVHGLGFAGALYATPIPHSVFLPAIILFNVGIELGQFSIIALAFPFLYLMNKNRYKQKIALAISTVVLFTAIVLIILRLK